MDETLKNFINENLDLINENTKESWEQLYQSLKSPIYIGRFTKILSAAGINPIEKLDYIPDSYMYGLDITSYIVPSNITRIERLAFSECTSLMHILLPDNLTYIGDSAFYNCNKVSKIILPNSVTFIGSGAFSTNSALAEISLSDNIKSIGDLTFQDCKNLVSIKIPDGVISIGKYAFVNCDSLIDVTIPNTVKKISTGAFNICSNLREIKFDGTKQQAAKLKIWDQKKWRVDSPIQKIICTDGEIEL